MKRRYAVAIAGILVLFAVGLIGYFVFSANGSDGLEKTMENGGVQETPSGYHAPFSYGDSYFGTLTAGIIGFSATLGLVFGYLKISKRKKMEP